MSKSRYCGPVDQYDYMGGMQFCNLFMLGMRSHHTLLDFGSGSLRLGKLAIIYLNKGNYFAIEPQKKLIDEGVKINSLESLIKIKGPHFRISSDCNMFYFKIKFDFIIAQSVFTHMPISQVDKSLNSAYLAMKKKSLFLANYHPGGRTYGGKNWTQGIAKISPEIMEGLIQKNNLVSTPVHLIHTHLQTWLMIRR